MALCIGFDDVVSWVVAVQELILCLGHIAGEEDVMGVRSQ